MDTREQVVGPAPAHSDARWIAGGTLAAAALAAIIVGASISLQIGEVNGLHVIMAGWATASALIAGANT
jgi:hypothetical protein